MGVSLRMGSGDYTGLGVGKIPTHDDRMEHGEAWVVAIALLMGLRLGMIRKQSIATYI
jgi:hypothetical protein